MSSRYSVSVYDYNPADGGGDAWGHEFALTLDNPPQYGQRSIDVRNENITQAEALENAIRKAAAGECEKGDKLWVQFGDDDYGVVCWSMRI